MHYMGTRLLLGTACAVLASACTGNLTEESGLGAAGPRGGATSGPTGTPGEPPPASFNGAPSGLRRLTVAQYKNSIKDLLGAEVTVSTVLEADTVLQGFASIGASRIALSPLGTEQFEVAAFEVAKQAFADVGRRASLAGCDPMSESGCAERFVASFGQRAFRRPLTQPEVARYAAVGAAAQQALGDPWASLEYATAGLLQSPHFLYRVELGAPDPRAPATYRFDDFEVATRLAYFVWNTTPDDALLAAAASGRISNASGLLVEAKRLLDSPRAASGLANFFDEYLKLSGLLDLPQLPSAFPQMSPTLGEAMRSETQRVMSLHALSGGDYRDVFDSRTTFVNAELARLYELAPVTGNDFVQVELPEAGLRAGLLGQGSFLALNAHADAASATLRGKFIREVLLCQAIPPPPPGVVAVLPATSPGAPQTRRQKLAIHSQVPACAGCHLMMDPIGLGLANFDGIGAFRSAEEGLPIDASGELDGVAFQDPAELGRALRAHPGVVNCLARSVYRYAAGHLETAGEEALVAELEARLIQQGYAFPTLLAGVIESPGFRYAGAPQ